MRALQHLFEDLSPKRNGTPVSGDHRHQEIQVLPNSLLILSGQSGRRTCPNATVGPAGKRSLIQSCRAMPQYRR